MDYTIDIQENEWLTLSEEILQLLLKDHTTQRNIFWATDSYEQLGKGYQYHDPITIEAITGDNRGQIIRPRALKSKEEQAVRTKDKAEVFTPSWLCNEQNNLIDEAWFGYEAPFNCTDPQTHQWTSKPSPIAFPTGKSWKAYVKDTRLEVACGEAPYLVSRYDTTTGDFIPIPERIGILDRKLRVVSENCTASGEWLQMAQRAYKSCFGFEWQGDSLLLARESLLVSFIEYYHQKFGTMPLLQSIRYIAYIVSWNLWQMDGLKGVVPESCKDGVTEKKITLFGEEEETLHCRGCQDEGYKNHNGIYCMLRDWGRRDPKTGESNRKIRFIDLIK